MNIINGTWIQTLVENIFNNVDIIEKNSWHICGSIETINTEPVILYTPPSGTRFYVTDIIMSVNNDNFIRLREGDNGCKNIFLFNVNTQANSGTNINHSFSKPYMSDIDGELRIMNSTAAKIDYAIQGYYK